MRVYKISEKVGRRIRKYRNERKLSQADLAEMVGVHYNHIGRIERAESNPSLPLVGKIAKALKVKTTDLL